MSLDLTGLPPTFEQAEAFAADPRPDAYERLIEDLLASPRFGEKWARHWLDVARYAEDQSTGESTCKPPRFPFRYRDWVIRALNADVPFDRFVRLQLAADRMPGVEPADLAALGFLGLSPVAPDDTGLPCQSVVPTLRTARPTSGPRNTSAVLSAKMRS